MANKTMVLKLLIDTTANRVLFAEAGKEVVDFLFTLLAMPLGSIVKFLSKGQMVGSIGSMYRSLENLDSTYIQPNQDKNILLNPQLQQQNQCQNNLLLLAPAPTKAEVYYGCGLNYCKSLCTEYFTKVSGAQCPSCDHRMDRCLLCVHPKPEVYYGCGYSYRKTSCTKYVTKVCGTRCPSCQNIMDRALQCVHGIASGVNGGEEGLVKGVVTYTIMDDLSVTLMSTISSITLLSKFNVKNLDVLKEKNISLGMQEALELLKASLASKTVLTDVFLAGKE